MAAWLGWLGAHTLSRSALGTLWALGDQLPTTPSLAAWGSPTAFSQGWWLVPLPQQDRVRPTVPTAPGPLPHVCVPAGGTQVSG